MGGIEDLFEGLRVSTRLNFDHHSHSPLLTYTFGPYSSTLFMATKLEDKVDPDSLAATDPKKAEAIYKSILQGLLLNTSRV